MHGHDLRRAASALALCAVLLDGCGGSDEPAGAQVLRLAVETRPGAVRFDKQRLTATAGSSHPTSGHRPGLMSFSEGVARVTGPGNEPVTLARDRC